MATLEDPAVLSKLEELRNESPSSFSLSELSILNLVSDKTTGVAVRWISYNYKETVEASTIRFRDLEAEGRGSARASRRRPVTVAPATRQTPKKGKKATTTTKTPKTRNPRGGLGGQPNTTTTKRAPSANSSIVTAEGRDDDDDNNLDDSGNSTQLSAIGTLKGPSESAEGKSLGGASNNDNSRQQTMSVPQNQNAIDLHDDEDTDSSDDDDEDENTVKRDQSSSDGSFVTAGDHSTFRNQLSKKRRRNGSTTSSEDTNEKFVHKNKKKRARGSSGRSSNDGDSDYINYSDSDSFSFPTEASSKTSGSKRQQQQHQNGCDSGEDGNDNVVGVENGQTNMTNWMKMKQFFTNFV